MSLEVGLWGLLGALVTGVFGVLAQRVIAQSAIQKARVEAKATTVQTDSQRIQSLWDRVDTLSSQVSTLQTQVLDLRSELGAEQSKRHALVQHVHDWRTLHPDRGSWPRLPPILHDDLAT
ncbi:hypothetical protein [Corynebacterium kalidii]|uniref:Uncharacterized protein n=1 Tax=Corynebacterium kalidii TaxID=2931982 RepID=A0A9X1WL13_9CORY|nr:hypothetical protein [Corynebacterium kalidii]MCJ7859285.1 hypothetical protein [Corynebacterium kalidii]